MRDAAEKQKNCSNLEIHGGITMKDTTRSLLGVAVISTGVLAVSGLVLAIFSHFHFRGREVAGLQVFLPSVVLFIVFAPVAVVIATVAAIMARATPSSVVSIAAKVAVAAASVTVVVPFIFFVFYELSSPLPEAYFGAAYAAAGVAVISAMISGFALLRYKKDPQGHLPKQRPEENTSTKEV
jgi:glucan phosphoethanolaminetransferase (alkaline phosphatase superfamily)